VAFLGTRWLNCFVEAREPQRNLLGCNHRFHTQGHIIWRATNWSRGELRIQVRVPLEVLDGTTVEKLKAVLLEVADENPSALKAPEPTVYYDGFGASTLLLELGACTSQMTRPPRRFRSKLNFAMERKRR
jgi:small-conductance mechanosensitive channel